MPSPESPDANPIARRLDVLLAQWTAFSEDTEARLLRWELDADELPMLEAFLTREAAPEEAQTADVFVELDASFADPQRHGFLLAGRLAALYDADREALREAGLAAEWRAPRPRSGAGDVETLIETLVSFRASFANDDEKLVVWLRPEAVADEGEYVLWLQRLVHAAPPELRFLVAAHGPSPAFDLLASRESARVKTERAGLDMPAALEEASAAAGNLDTPGGQFRHLHIQILGAAKKGDLPRAQELGAKALTIAEGQSWFHLAGTVHFVLGNLLMQAGRHGEAIERFVAADKAGVASDAAGEPYGKKIRLQARLCVGSTMIVAGAFAQGARAFADAVPLARAVQDSRAELDCWRLASYCHEQAARYEDAWEAALAGLKVAKGMDEETRKTSTLQFLADAMARLTKHRSLSHYGPGLERQLLGLVDAQGAA